MLLKLVILDEMFRCVSWTAFGSFSLPLVKRITALSSASTSATVKQIRDAGNVEMTAALSFSDIVTLLMMSSIKTMPSTIGQLIFSMKTRDVMIVRKLHRFCAY